MLAGSCRGHNWSRTKDTFGLGNVVSMAIILMLSTLQNTYGLRGVLKILITVCNSNLLQYVTQI